MPASAAPARAPLLSVRGLGVSFDNPGNPRTRAVDAAWLTIHPRQTLAVVGESGCGKSVSALATLRLLPCPPARFDRGVIDFARKDGSRVDLLSLDERAMRQIRGAEIAMIFQEPMTSLNPVFTVGEQLAEAVLLHQRVTQREAREIVLTSMRDVGIVDPSSRLESYPHQFSGGMRQRIMIAMALACQPRLLLADEPTTALDVTIQAQVLDLIWALKESRGLGVMLITHDLGVVAQHSDVVAVMYAGRVVEYARTSELFARPLHPYTRALMACIPRLGARRERLATIREAMDDPAQFQGVRDAGPDAAGLRPWWLWHPSPPDLALREDDDPTHTDRDFALIEVAPSHWLGCWRTPAALAFPQRPPDVDTVASGA